MNGLRVDPRYVAHVMDMLHIEVTEPVLQYLAEALETQLQGLGHPVRSELADTDPEMTFDPRWRR